MNRNNNGDYANVIIKDPPGENYKWIRNQSSSELQKFQASVKSPVLKDYVKYWNGYNTM